MDSYIDENEWLSHHSDRDISVPMSLNNENKSAFQSPTHTNRTLNQVEYLELEDTCSICLHTPVHPAMLKTCYHVYCQACLIQWANIAANQKLQNPSCPLCKISFDTAYINVVSELHYDLLKFDLTKKDSIAIRYSEQYTKNIGRLKVYSDNLTLVKVNNTCVPSPIEKLYPLPKKIVGEYEEWVTRELYACLGTSDIDLTVLMSIIKLSLNEITSRWKHHMDKVSEFYTALQQELQPFLGELYAEKFVWELAWFLSTRLNLQTYDSIVEYKAGSTTH